MFHLPLHSWQKTVRKHNFISNMFQNIGCWFICILENWRTDRRMDGWTDRQPENIMPLAPLKWAKGWKHYYYINTCQTSTTDKSVSNSILYHKIWCIGCKKQGQKLVQSKTIQTYVFIMYAESEHKCSLIF